MIKLSIDLEVNQEKHEPIRQEVLVEIASGCRRVLNGLGPLASLVEVFRVTWANFDNKGFGPVITVHFHDPMSEHCSHGTDFRFMGRGTTSPTADEIENHLLSVLPRLMKERVGASKTKLAKVKKVFKSLEGIN